MEVLPRRVEEKADLSICGKEVLNANGPIVPAMKRVGSFTQSLSRVQISTMAVKDNLMVAGGFHGELICKNTSVSPDGKLLVVLGDNVNCLIVDAQSGKVVESLRGHLDYSFASAWHLDGVDPSYLVTVTAHADSGREESFSINHWLSRGRMGAIRAIKFSSDGDSWQCPSQPDFVHIYDTQSEYSREQEIDLFGEIARISFSPDTKDLFVAVADRTYGSLLEYNRKRSNQYLYTII
ncbi:hypothetical protein IFM89_017471 [Coptis chinensis]|uniref:Uncharacterized protein n=1 Tax=Coptis chinensis TaxID=261450 RepID=A0A835LUJ0_9MAGN|nr:hypothetical protein IFM89_017471 [Coptis chinensis]